jgi:hypothetical protein
MGSFILSYVTSPFLTSKNLTVPSIDDAQIYQSVQMTFETESLKFFMVSIGLYELDLLSQILMLVS